MRLLCFDIGGTAIKYGIVENGIIIEKNQTSTDAQSSLEVLTNKLELLASSMLEKYEVSGVGVSCAGGIDIKQGKIITPPEAIPNFKDWDFLHFFESRYGLKCVADNDVNCFAVAESTSGAGVDFKNFLTITIGTGIGGGIILNNKLWRGINYNAGEVGRMLIGNGEKFERLASLSALIRRAKRYGLNIDNGLELFNLYDNNDKIAVKAVQDFYQYLSLGLANLIYIFNPEAIIIGGGISNREQFLTELNEAMNCYLVEGFKNTAILKRAHYKNDGGMIGAYYNYINQYGEE